MGVMVQIRNMPVDVHRVMKARAAKAGLSLSDYLLDEIRTAAELPTLEEWRAQVESRPRLTLPISPTEIIREERDSR